MMDVPADHTVNMVATRFSAQRLLELTDEIDGILHFELDPARQRPIRQAKQSANAVEMRIQSDREIVGSIAEQREPARVPNHHVKEIAVNHQKASAIGRHVYGLLD